MSLADELLKGHIFDICDSILKQRESSYGDSKKMLGQIAKYWNVYISSQYDKDNEGKLQGKDVAMMMLLLKIARESYKHDVDNIIDMINYITLYEKEW